MKMYGRAAETAQRIVDAFREPERLPKALAPLFIHRKDDVPCRKWSWHNQLLAALAGTSDARGLRQWSALGRKVKRGSKAVWILAPCVKVVRETDAATGEESRRSILYGFRGVPVFAVEDTEGKPLPGNERLDEWVRGLPLVEVAEDWGIHVDTYSHEGRDPLGYYRFAGRKAILLGTENLATWAHELVHAADERLTKFAGPPAVLEIVAELGSAILLETLGHSHDADLGGAHDYIARYAEKEKKSPVQACSDVLDRACNCVALILDTAESLQQQPATHAV